MRSPVIPLFLLLLGLGLLAAVPTTEAATCAPRETGSNCNVPFPPPTFTTPGQRSNSILTGVEYGWIEDYAPFYDAPDPDSRRVRTASVGFFYGPVQESATDSQDQPWIKVWDNWLPERYYHKVQASTFTGVEVNANPTRPFGWILRPFQPRPGPAAEAQPDTPELQRYDFVQIYGSTRGDDGAIWHDIGDGQWVRYHVVALLTVRPRPQGVEPHEYWVDVDLSQQIFAAYEGDRMVFAGLISSGLARWPTRIGLFRVWSRHLTTPMSGGEVGDDYYYLQDVPHTLYYDGPIALHGAYWHDDFGRPKSHGCVNIPPQAAEWLFFWSQNAPGDLRVWVHTSTYLDFLQ